MAKNEGTKTGWLQRSSKRTAVLDDELPVMRVWVFIQQQ